MSREDAETSLGAAASKRAMPQPFRAVEASRRRGVDEKDPLAEPKELGISTLRGELAPPTRCA